MSADARHLLLSTIEAAAAVVQLAEARDWVQQMLSGIENPVVTPLPYHGVLLNGELHSVYATPEEAAAAAGPGM
ncbi:hypothetical protein, partial [Streptomyces sp. NPDC057557]